MDSVPIEEHVVDTSSVLLLAPSRSAADDHACIDLLTTVDPGRGNVLSITLSETPDDRLAVWQRHAGGTLPKRGAVVHTGEQAHADAVADIPSLSVDLLPESPGPADVGLVVGQYLGAWETTAEPTLVCLHSLTDLVDRTGLEDVVELVKALNSTFDDRDVGAHYHLDPGSHDEDTVNRLRPLFDAAVEHSGERGWTVTTTGADEAAPLFSIEGHDAEDETPTTPPTNTVSLTYSFDTVVDALSSSYRRKALYFLKEHPGETLPVEAVVDGILDREREREPRLDAAARRDVEVSLHHVHLPMLADRGIVEFSADDGTVRYHENPALRTCIEHAESLESD